MIHALLIAAATVAAQPDWPSPDTALVTYESGQRVGVDWIQQRGRRLHSLSMLMRSGFRDARIDLGPDATARHSSTRVWSAGAAPEQPIERELGADVVYWSDQVPSSIEQAVLRARALGQATCVIPGASLYRDSRTPIAVERVDGTDWVVTCNLKRYEVLTDAAGRVLSASLPDYGVVIERRIGLRPGDDPAWAAYAAPAGAPYRATDARIPTPQGHVLAGTLTLPAGHGPFGAAILITGLSPHERNNGDPPWMPFRDIADALSRRGIAVLRVDDRGVGQSTGDHAPSTTFDEADDVRSELRWLRAQRSVDPRRVLLVGYSEGGLIAPMVAADERTLAGIVTLAGPGVSGQEVARYQIEAAVMADSTVAPGAKPAEIARQLADSLTAREASYLSIDPMAYARRVQCPALILQGGSDRHVPVRSAERLAWAMRANGNADVTVRLFPGVSHAFLPDPVGLNAGWAALPGFETSPEVLRAIADWAVMHIGPAAARDGVSTRTR